MSDVALLWQIDHADIAIDGADLQSDDGLDTAVILSLFLDRRAAPDDILPPGTDPRGWWADTFADVQGDLIGSRLWLLGREKQLASVAQRAQEYAEEALAWLVQDGVSSSVAVVATWIARGTLGLSVSIQRPAPQQPFNRKYQYVWSAM